ncbi:hypothetical protein FRB97_005629 [Tulasnella sp. 331]|nr:hypothetical protein FRB97_005629 [Tulasnella sp. 331]
MLTVPAAKQKDPPGSHREPENWKTDPARWESYDKWSHPPKPIVSAVKPTDWIAHEPSEPASVTKPEDPGMRPGEGHRFGSSTPSNSSTPPYEGDPGGDHRSSDLIKPVTPSGGDQSSDEHTDASNPFISGTATGGDGSSRHDGSGDPSLWTHTDTSLGAGETHNSPNPSGRTESNIPSGGNHDVSSPSDFTTNSSSTFGESGLSNHTQSGSDRGVSNTTPATDSITASGASKEPTTRTEEDDRSSGANTPSNTGTSSAVEGGSFNHTGSGGERDTSDRAITGVSGGNLNPGGAGSSNGTGVGEAHNRTTSTPSGDSTHSGETLAGGSNNTAATTPSGDNTHSGGTRNAANNVTTVSPTSDVVAGGGSNSTTISTPAGNNTHSGNTRSGSNSTATNQSGDNTQSGDTRGRSNNSTTITPSDNSTPVTSGGSNSTTTNTLASNSTHIEDARGGSNNTATFTPTSNNTRSGDTHGTSNTTTVALSNNNTTSTAINIPVDNGTTTAGGTSDTTNVTLPNNGTAAMGGASNNTASNTQVNNNMQSGDTRGGSNSTTTFTTSGNNTRSGDTHGASNNATAITPSDNGMVVTGGGSNATTTTQTNNGTTVSVGASNNGTANAIPANNGTTIAGGASHDTATITPSNNGTTTAGGVSNSTTSNTQTSNSTHSGDTHGASNSTTTSTGGTHSGDPRSASNGTMTSTPTTNGTSMGTRQSNANNRRSATHRQSSNTHAARDAWIVTGRRPGSASQTLFPNVAEIRNSASEDGYDTGGTLALIAGPSLRIYKDEYTYSKCKVADRLQVIARVSPHLTNLTVDIQAASLFGTPNYTACPELRHVRITGVVWENAWETLSDFALPETLTIWEVCPAPHMTLRHLSTQSLSLDEVITADPLPVSTMPELRFLKVTPQAEEEYIRSLIYLRKTSLHLDDLRLEALNFMPGMFVDSISYTIVCLVSTSLAITVPGPGDLGTNVINIGRRGFRTKAPIGPDDQDFVFDPTYPRNEIKRILSKYKYAEKILHVVDLPQPVAQEFEMAQTIEQVVAVNATSGDVGAAGFSAKTAQMPLIDDIVGNLDVEYYGPLQMGTQQQRMTVDIDTGSADLWVPVACQGCPHPSYNAGGSASYRTSGRSFEVTYGSGSVSGTLGQDRVAIGNLVIDKQYFGAVNQESNDFEDSPNDGLIGMAFSSIASCGEPTFFENLISSSRIAAPLFSVHLARSQSRGSQLCLGCFDQTKAKGGVTWVSVTSRTYWAVSMPGVTVNGRVSMGSRPVTAAIDTGTTLIYFPRQLAEAFYNTIPGSQQANQYGDGFYTYPCDSQLTISLQFGSNTYAMNTMDFNLGRTSRSSTDCVGGILAMGGDFPTDLAIIGDEFLKSWYSVYDYSHGARVGFAPSINNS